MEQEKNDPIAEEKDPAAKAAADDAQPENQETTTTNEAAENAAANGAGAPLQEGGAAAAGAKRGKEEDGAQQKQEKPEKQQPPKSSSTCRPFAAPADLTQEERRLQICLYLSLRLAPDGRLARGAIESAASAFGARPSGVRGIWVRNKDALLHPETYKLDVARRAGSGRNQKYSEEQIDEMVRAAGPGLSVRALAERTGVAKSTLHRILSSSKKGQHKRKAPGGGGGQSGRGKKPKNGEEKKKAPKNGGEEERAPKNGGEERTTAGAAPYFGVGQRGLLDAAGMDDPRENNRRLEALAHSALYGGTAAAAAGGSVPTMGWGGGDDAGEFPRAYR